MQGNRAARRCHEGRPIIDRVQSVANKKLQTVENIISKAAGVENMQGANRNSHCNRVHNQEPDALLHGATKSGLLSRSAQCRAEVAQLVVDLVGFAHRFGNFFAEQSAITLTQPVD
jgi:hypothetical protein